MLHCPAESAAVQESTPSLTVTLPVGVPVPGATMPTLQAMVTASPTNDGSGVTEVIVVVVDATLTV